MKEPMQLSQSMFEQCPVWADDEFDEGFEPVYEHNPLPEDLGNLYLKTTFTTAQGILVPGCIRSDLIFAAFFVESQVLTFNALLPLRPEEIIRLGELFPGTDGRIFPVSFTTPYAFPDEAKIEGTFEPGAKAWP